MGIKKDKKPRSGAVNRFGWQRNKSFAYPLTAKPDFCSRQGLR